MLLFTFFITFSVKIANCTFLARKNSNYYQYLPVPKCRNSIRHFRVDESYVPSYFAHLAMRKSNAFEKHTNSRFPVSGHQFLDFRMQVFLSNCRLLAWYSIVFFWLFPAYPMMAHSVQSCFVP